MLWNVGARACLAFLFADVWSRKMFVNYDALEQHKAGQHEVRKLMRKFPNARPHIPAHERPNSWYYA